MGVETDSDKLSKKQDSFHFISSCSCSGKLHMSSMRIFSIGVHQRKKVPTT